MQDLEVPTLDSSLEFSLESSKEVFFCESPDAAFSILSSRVTTHSLLNTVSPILLLSTAAGSSTELRIWGGGEGFLSISFSCNMQIEYGTDRHFCWLRDPLPFAMISQRLLSSVSLRKYPISRRLSAGVVLKISASVSTYNGKANVNGVELHFEVRGDGAHTILCIPGALGTARTDFEPQLGYFGKRDSGFKIVSFDPRGYGASRPADRFGGNFFIQDALDAVGLMKHLSLKSYSVLGWSDGGIAALFLAALHNEHLRKLVIWGANAFTTPEEFEFYESIRDISTWSPKMRQPLLDIYGESLQSMWSGWMDSVREVIGKNNGDICKDELRKIQCPTLIVHGAKDPLVPSLHPEYLHKHIIGSHLVVMEDGRHNLHLKYSSEFNKTVEEFLKF